MELNDVLLDPSKSESSCYTSGEEVLYDLLFTDEKNLKYHQQLNESLTYLQELNSFHLDRLQSEPRNLFEQKQNIQEEIKNLAFSNYKTFIRTAQCSKDIYSEFSVIENKLDTLIQNIPLLYQTSESFTKNIHNINTSRRSNNLTLQKHNQLLEILEISQLMETCVRNEYYEEALDLANYVKRLDKKYSSTIPLVQQIVDDVNKSLNSMLTQLLQQLKSNLQFNQCLKIIGLIRRLDVFTEPELRIKFLQLRDSWLQNLLQRIPTNEPYYHVTKTMEEMRTHLFDIITHYRAIFSDDDVSSNLLSPNQDKLFSLLNRDLNESKLFYCWLQQKIKLFLKILESDLKLGVGNRLDSVLSQSMYFGLAFSRVGLDFRGLMMPLFEKTIYEQFDKNLNTAGQKFEESLNKLNWSELSSDKSRLKDFYDSKSSSTIINPPIQLLDYQPLALYLNTVLHSFNDLRLCLPLSLYSRVFQGFKNSFRKMSTFVGGYVKKQSFDKNEQEVFGQFMLNMTNVMVQFIEKCFVNLFSFEQLQKKYGVSQIEMDKMKRSLRFDVNELFVEVQHLIPEVKIEEPVKVEEKPEEVEEEEMKEENVDNKQEESEPILAEF